MKKLKEMFLGKFYALRFTVYTLFQIFHRYQLLHEEIIF